ncbi:MAG: metallophosphoesterase [Actinomycetota bacterium]|nr:metallophosphoesterase [Actinomycetota bacterium]
MVRIAAAGDVHASEHTRGRIVAAFAAIEPEADLVLLAGDLTTHGEPEQAEVLADAVRPLEIPVAAVLGNHDLHSGHGDEIAEIFRDAGVHMLDRDATVFDLGGEEVGVVGTKGFVGGFAGSQLPDFGEPLLRRVYAETTEEVDAIRRGLQEIAHCRIRIVLLHYAPTSDTLHGEPEGIWTYLGSDRLATPIAEYRPDVVLHGHAHSGSFEGGIGGVPVYNVAVHVTGRDFYVFELEGHEVEVETRA